MDIQALIPSVIAFVVGGFVGFFGRGLFDKSNMNKGNTANMFVLIVVTVIWAISVLIDIASSTYETSHLIHALMGTIVGFFFKPWQSNGHNSTRSSNEYTQGSELELKSDKIRNKQQEAVDVSESKIRNKYDEEITSKIEDLEEAKRRKEYDETKERRRKK